jgi:hypothetical protein
VYAKQKGFPYWPAKVGIPFGMCIFHGSNCLIIINIV